MIWYTGHESSAVILGITRRLLRRSHFTLASRLVKYHRNTLKNNLKHVDVLHFLTAVTSWSQTFRGRHNKNPYKTNRVQRYHIEKHRKVQAHAQWNNKIRPTITASTICNVVKHESRSDYHRVELVLMSVVNMF